MSGGAACKQRAQHESQWVVVQRLCNHSAFNGWHRTRSAWSEVYCRACQTTWRTKARYVSALPDGRL